MPDVKNCEQKSKVPRESGGEDSEDDCDILEESPCGRWLKRREEVGVLDHFTLILNSPVLPFPSIMILILQARFQNLTFL